MKFGSGDLAVCETCGTQYDIPLSSAPQECRICLVSDVNFNLLTVQALVQINQKRENVKPVLLITTN